MSDFDLENNNSNGSADPDPNPSAETASTAEYGAQAYSSNDTIAAPVQEPFSYTAPTGTGSSPNLALEKRKKAPGWLFGIAAGLVAILAIVIAFIAVPSLSNAFSLATLSPLKYYSKVELANLDKNIDSFTKNYGEYMSYYQADSEELTASTGVSLNMKASVDPSFGELLEIPGMENLKEAALNMTILSKENGDVKANYELLYGNDLLASMIAYIQTDSPVMYFQVKELSEAFLKMNMDENVSMDEYGVSYDTSQILAAIKDFPLTEDILNLLLKRYSKTIVNEVKNVTLAKKETRTIREISGKNTKITVTLKEEDIYNIASAVIKEAEEDKELLDLVIKLADVTEAEYDAFLSLAKVGLESVFPQDGTVSEDAADMIVWVDNKGKITGREFILKTGSAEIGSLGYGTLTNKDEMGYQFFVKEGNSDLITLDGLSTIKNSAYSGDCKLLISADDMPIDISVNYTDFKTIDQKNATISGKLNITSSLLPEFEFVMDCNGEADSQKMIFDFLYNNAKTVTLNLDTKLIPFEDFEMPSVDNTYDMNSDAAMNDYLATANLPDFIANIQEITGLDLYSLMEDFDSIPDMPSADSAITVPSGITAPAEEPMDPAEEPADPENTAASSLPEGITPDENGYYAYEADYDTIMAAGESGTGYVTFPVKAASIQADVEALAKKILGDKITVSEPFMYNQIIGMTDPDYGYENSYYQTTVNYLNQEDYSSVSFIYDSVTDEIIQIQISLKEEDRTKESLISYLELLKQPLSDSDKADILKALVPADGEDYAFYTYDNNASLYFSLSDDTCIASISAE